MSCELNYQGLLMSGGDLGYSCVVKVIWTGFHIPGESKVIVLKLVESTITHIARIECTFPILGDMSTVLILKEVE